MCRRLRKNIRMQFRSLGFGHLFSRRLSLILSFFSVYRRSLERPSSLCFISFIGFPHLFGVLRKVSCPFHVKRTTS